MKNIEKLGLRIKYLREERKLTQEQFEGLTDVNASYLSALERGQKNVTFEVLERVASGLKIDLLQLFMFDSQDETPSRKAVEKIFLNLPDDRLKKALKIAQILSE